MLVECAELASSLPEFRLRVCGLGRLPAQRLIIKHKDGATSTPEMWWWRHLLRLPSISTPSTRSHRTLASLIHLTCSERHKLPPKPCSVGTLNSHLRSSEATCQLLHYVMRESRYWATRATMRQKHCGTQDDHRVCLAREAGCGSPAPSKRSTRPLLLPSTAPSCPCLSWTFVAKSKAVAPGAAASTANAAPATAAAAAGSVASSAQMNYTLQCERKAKILSKCCT